MLGFDDLWAEGWLKKGQMPFKIGSDLILNVEKAQSVVFIVCSFQKGSLPILYLKKLHIHNADGLAYFDKRDLVLVLSQKQFVLFKFFFTAKVCSVQKV